MPKPPNTRFILDLEKLLARQEAVTAAIRTTLDAARGSAPPSPNGHLGVLDEALALDAARRAGRPRKKGTRGKRQPTVGRVQRQRQASATFLGRFDTVEPRRFANRSTGSLVRRGYLTKRGDGYVRTSKPYTV